MMLGGGLLIAGIVAAGLVFGNGPSTPGFDVDDYDQYLEEMTGQVTVEGFEDPWVPSGEGVPAAAGRRYVAFEVTVENDGGSGDFPVYVSSSSFKLTDSDRFAYQPVYGRMEPGLPEGIQLEDGEKAHGWVLFEIDEDAEVESLSYFSAELPLPQQVSR
jgi:hypothetical protein